MRHTLLAALMTLCAVTVATAAPTGVTVNGVALDSAGSGGEGWKYYLPHITLTNAGPFTISGTNKTSQVRVVVQEGVTCDVTISNLVLETPGSDSRCAFTLQTNACVSLFLAGNNALLSGDNRAGLEVAGGRALSINSAPGDDAGALTATGGKYAAGIGGNNKNESGTITIHGGQITAYGTDGAAGIGGGSQGAGGTTTINGGHVSASSTGTYGAGIGGGYYRAGGTITINGGTVFPSPDDLVIAWQLGGLAGVNTRAWRTYRMLDRSAAFGKKLERFMKRKWNEKTCQAWVDFLHASQAGGGSWR